MNVRKWVSILAGLLAVVAILVVSVGFTWAQASEASQEPEASDIVVQPVEPDGQLTSVAAVSYDFLAIGVYNEDVSGFQDAGAVNVIYNSGSGLSADGDQFWYEGHNGMLGSPEEYDLFGDTLAVGDFDNDGNLDLVIGVPFEDYNTVEDAGIVHVLYGASGALSSTNTETWHQGSTGIIGSGIEAFDQFGRALAVGDFDNDGYDDLAVGVPGQKIGDDEKAGVVNVIYGSSGGLTAAGNQVWRQGADGILGFAEAEDRFGWSLAAADFDNDGYDDLAVGVPYEDINGNPIINNTGGVNIIYGSVNGLDGADTWWIAQNLTGILGAAQVDDLFGWSLAVGDIDGDNYADLAVGVPYEDWNGANSGCVNLIYGSVNGLSDVGDQLWYQGNNGVLDTAEEGDRFGYTLTAGDFDDDGHDDLVVGVPYEDVGTTISAGNVHVLYGSVGGIDTSRNLLLEQRHPDILNNSEVGDRFGMALAVGNFNGDRYMDLAIGAPGEDISIFMGPTYVDAGAVNVIFGSDTGLTFDGDQFWHQNSTGIEDTVGSGDAFGHALAAYAQVSVTTPTYQIFLPIVQRD